MTHSQGRSTATVELDKDGETFHDSATADGPCDAAFRAIDRITGLKGTIEDFSVHTLDSGKAGVAEVSIVSGFDSRRFVGKASRENVVEAAAQAYLQASNKALFDLQRVKEDRNAASAQPVARQVSS